MFPLSRDLEAAQKLDPDYELDLFLLHYITFCYVFMPLLQQEIHQFVTSLKATAHHCNYSLAAYRTLYHQLMYAAFEAL